MDNSIPGSCSLADRDCVPCRGGLPPLKGAELQQLLEQLNSDWELIDEHHLRKAFSFPDFRQALDFTMRVGELAENVNHHPRIELSWGEVVVFLWTHKINGLADADFVFAAKVDQLRRS